MLFVCTELLSADALTELDLAEYKAVWTTRYQVHVRCRGVLAAKGFNVAVERK